MDPATRADFEALYGVLVPRVVSARGVDTNLHSVLLSAVVQLARVLGKPCPVQTRESRRQARDLVVE